MWMEGWAYGVLIAVCIARCEFKSWWSVSTHSRGIVLTHLGLRCSGVWYRESEFDEIIRIRAHRCAPPQIDDPHSMARTNTFALFHEGL